MSRVVLHSDLNSFFANVECFYQPEIRHRPVAVSGGYETRSGIILASNQNAKQFGVKTGQVIWEAQQKCPMLHVVPPHYDLYVKHSKSARRIYEEYSPFVEAFGIDENFIELTKTPVLRRKTGIGAAFEIKERIQFELGITVSIGVSFNKTFAKLGSDIAPPNSLALITRQNYKEVVWPLPVSKLLYVGPATTRELHRAGVLTIGDLANSESDWLSHKFGKRGIDLWRTANGIDHERVTSKNYKPAPKSVGNSTTTARDMVTWEDIKVTLMMLSEMVAERMRAISYECRTLQVSMRYTDLFTYQRQVALPFPTTTANAIYQGAMQLVKEHWNGKPLRSIGVRACDISENLFPQLSFCPEIQADRKMEELETAVQGLRGRYGKGIVQKGCMMAVPELTSLGGDDSENLNSVAFKRE